MANINMLRGILVAGAVFAAVLAAVFGQWVATFILGAAVAAHAAYWVRLHRERTARTDPAGQPPTVNPS